MKIWNWNNDGKIITGAIEVESMEQARQLARAWNRHEKRVELYDGTTGRAVQLTPIAALELIAALRDYVRLAMRKTASLSNLSDTIPSAPPEDDIRITDVKTATPEYANGARYAIKVGNSTTYYFTTRDSAQRLLTQLQ